MKFPITTFLNFFKDPDIVLEYAKGLDYVNDDEFYPGKRTDDLYNLNRNFFYFIHKKIFSVLFNDINYVYETDYTGFNREKIEDLNKVSKYGASWIHRDPCELTLIVYLCREGLGTSIFKNKSTLHNCDFEEENGPYLGKNTNKKEMKFLKKRNEENFDLILSNNSIYNSAFVFPGHIYHKANLENFKKSDDRITLVSFIRCISSYKFPLDSFYNEDF